MICKNKHPVGLGWLEFGLVWVVLGWLCWVGCLVWVGLVWGLLAWFRLVVLGWFSLA